MPRSIALVLAGLVLLHATGGQAAPAAPDEPGVGPTPGAPDEAPYSAPVAAHAHSATGTEWIGVELSGGAVVLAAKSRAGAGPVAQLRIATLRWSSVYWTVAEAGLLYVNLDRDVFVLGGNLGTQIGLPLTFGARGQHQLKLGLGLGCFVGDVVGTTVNGGEVDGETSFALLLSPTARYSYQTAGGFFMGVSLRTSWTAPHPFGLLLLALDLGWAAGA